MLSEGHLNLERALTLSRTVQEGGRAPEPAPVARERPAPEPSIFQRRSTEAASRAAAAHSQHHEGRAAEAGTGKRGHQTPAGAGAQHESGHSRAASTSTTSAEGLRIMSLNQVYPD